MAKLYTFITFVGLMAVPAAFLMGWRYDPAAPAMNYLFNLIAFLIFMAIHIIMLLPGFKKLVYGTPYSTSVERRVYVMISIITWILLFAIHKPVPGPALPAIAWVQFLGICLVLLGFLMFFEGVTFEFLHAFMGTPGIDLSHTAEAVTPLMTEGSYASVRHPMYRGALTYPSPRRSAAVRRAGGAGLHPVYTFRGEGADPVPGRGIHRLHADRALSHHSRDLVGLNCSK